MKGTLCAGWAEIDLTPDKKVHLAGQFCERISEYVETRVCATALALDSGDDSAVFCACDLAEVNDTLLRAVRAALHTVLPEFDSDKLILSATHTHTSVQYADAAASTLSILKKYTPASVRYEDPLPAGDDVLSDEDALVFLTGRIAQVIAEAWRNRKPAQFANEFGRAAVGMCRRAKYDDLSAKMWGDTNTANFIGLEGGSDTGLELLYFFGADGKLTGVAANLACPAQSVQHRRFVSSDFWGKCKIVMREALGEDVFLLPLCSAAGDQCPVDLVRWVEPESGVDDPNIVRVNPPARKADPSMFDIPGSWKAGRRIAREIIECYDDAAREKRDADTFSHLARPVTLPVRMVTRKERDEAEEALRRFFESCAGKSLSFYDNASMHVHAGTLARYEYQQKHRVFAFEGHFLRLGDVAFATSPFELFLDYGDQIRAQSPAAQTILVQLACGSLGYLPTARAEEGSHYSAYVSSGMAGHVGGDLLVRETLDTIQKLFSE
ncbi:MAG: hypothetical protein VB055_03975 [Oscillospiraceae bacterium]|nr:hypothetical protein [Oscillospiraceae bacterium]